MTHISENLVPGSHDDDLRTILALHGVLLNAVDCGVCLLDDQFRVVLSNPRLLEILNVPRRRVRAGVPFRSLLEQDRVGGDRCATADMMWSDFEAGFAGKAPFSGQK